jgi:hypothetical protein
MCVWRFTKWRWIWSSNWLPADEVKIWQLFKADVGVDRLGMGTHLLQDDKIHYAYPVTVIVAERAV